MTNQHPITPPPELVREWQREANHNEALFPQVAARAAQWGADQELEACCKWLVKQGWFSADEHEAIEELRFARRPKPPSAIAQAESLIEQHEDGWYPSPAQWHIIREGLAEGRRALEQLDD